MSNRLQRFLTEDFNVNVKIQPEKEIEIDAKGDDIDEVEEFARCVLGDNCDFFGQSFDNEEDEIEEISNSEEVDEALNDNAVKDCKNYKLVAHCKEEKPVCNIEKPVLPDELTDPDLDMTDEEFYLAFGKAMKEKREALTEAGFLGKVANKLSTAATKAKNAISNIPAKATGGTLDDMFDSYRVVAKNEHGIFSFIDPKDKEIREYDKAVARAKSLAAQHTEAHVTTNNPKQSFKDATLDNKPLNDRVVCIAYGDGTVKPHTKAITDLYKKLISDPNFTKSNESPIDETAPDAEQGQEQTGAAQETPAAQTQAPKAAAPTKTPQAPKTKKTPDQVKTQVTDKLKQLGFAGADKLTDEQVKELQQAFK